MPHAGVAVGLVQHHFKTKDGLRSAVEQYIVDRHAAAIDSIRGDGNPEQVATGRNNAVRQMYDEHPALVDYMRRALLDPGDDNHLLERLSELAREQVVQMRASGSASTNRTIPDQVVRMMVRQLGHLFLQPMIDAMWAQLDTAEMRKPQLVVHAYADDRESRALSTDAS